MCVCVCALTSQGEPGLVCWECNYLCLEKKEHTVVLERRNCQGASLQKPSTLVTRLQAFKSLRIFTQVRLLF